MAEKFDPLHLFWVAVSVVVILVTFVSSVEYSQSLKSVKAITELGKELREKKKAGEQIEDIPDLVLINTGTARARRPQPEQIKAITAVHTDGRTCERRLISIDGNVFAKADKKKKKAYSLRELYSRKDPDKFLKALSDSTDLDTKYYIAIDAKTIIRLVDEVVFIAVNIKPEEVPLINRAQKKLDKELRMKRYQEITGPGYIQLTGFQAAAYANMEEKGREPNSRNRYFSNMVRVILSALKESSNEDVVQTKGIIFKNAKKLTKDYAKEFLARVNAFKWRGRAKWPVRGHTHSYNGKRLMFPKTLASNAKALHEAIGDEGYEPSGSLRKQSGKVKAALRFIEKEKKRREEEKRRREEEAARIAAEQERLRQEELMRQAEEAESSGAQNDVDRNANKNDTNKTQPKKDPGDKKPGGGGNKSGGESGEEDSGGSGGQDTPEVPDDPEDEGGGKDDSGDDIIDKGDSGGK